MTKRELIDYCLNTGAYISKWKYSVDDILLFTESFLGGGTNFEEPLTKGIDFIEHNHFLSCNNVAADIILNLG